MSEYTCNKCKKSFKQKGHLLNHLNKKKPCKDINSENNVCNNIEIVIKKHTCTLCQKSFTRETSLKRHLLNSCKENEYKIILLEEKINNLTEIMIKIADDKKIINNINNGTIDNSTNIANQVTSNITNTNIKIEFGKEDLNKISNDFFIKTLLNSTGALIPSKIIEGIHFNPELKEFMNVFISDLSRNKAMIFNGADWNIANADEIVDVLYDRAIIFCENRNEEMHEKIEKNDKIKKKINKEMYVIGIMNNFTPHDYDEHKQPIDSEGNVLNPVELDRGSCLNAKAKKHIIHSLCNKKTIIKNN
jgi:hypothetical protein